MSGQSVIICGLARDCADRLPAMIGQVEQLGLQFGSYEVIVVENGSNDNTGLLLDTWSEGNQRVNTVRFSLISDDEPSASGVMGRRNWFQASRIERICYARNLYLAELSARQADYVIVVDMDLLEISIEGIASSFATANGWNAVASNGLRYTLRAPFKPRVYWDTYAYEPDGGFEHDTQTLAGIRQGQSVLEQQLRKGEWLTARSAFGGLCVYRAHSLSGVEYSVLPNDNRDVPWLCEHIGLHRAIRKVNEAFRIHINPAQRVSYETFPTTLGRSVSAALGWIWR